MLNYSDYLTNVSNSLRRDGFKNLFTAESAIYSELMRVKTFYTDTLRYKINLFAFKTKRFGEDMICFFLKCTEPLDLERLVRDTMILQDLTLANEVNYCRESRID